jgi:hypothetical protein
MDRSILKIDLVDDHSANTTDTWTTTFSETITFERGSAVPNSLDSSFAADIDVRFLD